MDPVTPPAPDDPDRPREPAVGEWVRLSVDPDCPLNGLGEDGLHIWPLVNGVVGRIWRIEPERDSHPYVVEITFGGCSVVRDLARSELVRLSDSPPRTPEPSDSAPRGSRTGS